MKKDKKLVTLNLTGNLVRIIDKKREDIPRSRYIDKILCKYFNLLKGGKRK